MMIKPQIKGSSAMSFCSTANRSSKIHHQHLTHTQPVATPEHTELQRKNCHTHLNLCLQDRYRTPWLSPRPLPGLSASTASWCDATWKHTLSCCHHTGDSNMFLWTTSLTKLKVRRNTEGGGQQAAIQRGSWSSYLDHHSWINRVKAWTTTAQLN